MSIFEVPNQEPLLLQVNKSILNKSTEPSLMSMYKLGKFGIAVVNRPKKHGGTQNMVIDDNVVNFKLRHCMSYFIHRNTTQEEMGTVTSDILTQGKVAWHSQTAHHSTDEADAFEKEIAMHICKVSNVLEDEEHFCECTEECVIDVSTAWEYAIAYSSIVAAEADGDALGLEAVKPNLHRTLQAKIDYDSLYKYFCYHPSTEDIAEHYSVGQSCH